MTPTNDAPGIEDPAILLEAALEAAERIEAMS